MTTIHLPWVKPPLTKNAVRRMHYHVEAKARADAIDEASACIRRDQIEPRSGANVVLHWQMGSRRRQDGDGAAPTLAAVIDALVLEGVIPDDSWVHVPHSGVTCHPPIDGEPAAMWIELEEPA